ncbi:MAG: hypothetical protein HYV16_05590 [Gammaproteobacteria bacterium]|nr:hypothetical protein [Gammaproteobacteria bacterium]
MEAQELRRKALVKELLILQIKLGVDALVDFLLSPVVLLCGVIDIVRCSPPEQSLLPKLKAFGLTYEHWLGLFGPAAGPESRPGANADRILRHLELRAKRKLRQKRCGTVNTGPDEPAL